METGTEEKMGLWLARMKFDNLPSLPLKQDPGSMKNSTFALLRLGMCLQDKLYMLKRPRSLKTSLLDRHRKRKHPMHCNGQNNTRCTKFPPNGLASCPRYRNCSSKPQSHC